MPYLTNTNQITTLLIDLDDTLYSQDNGVWEMIRVRMNQFLHEEMGFAAEDVPALRHRLWHQYGTTLRGLQAEFSVDMDAFLDYVHDIPLDSILNPDPELDRILKSLPQRKVIFTNAYAPHAKRVINRLGIAHHFENIVDIYAIYPNCKPEIEAYQKAMQIIDETPSNCLLIDDMPGNLETARVFGMQTISVGNHRHDSSPHIESIHDLLTLFAA